MVQCIRQNSVIARQALALPTFDTSEISRFCGSSLYKNDEMSLYLSTSAKSQGLDTVSVAGSDYNAANIDPPPLTHSLKHDKSILALAVSSESLFAGTEGGEILVSHPNLGC